MLTKKRYEYATFYVDQASRLSYIINTTVNSTLKGKEAWEQYASSFGIKINAYHADNGIFKAKGLIDHCAKQHQTISFSRVNNHYQNGLDNCRIRLLQDMARSMLIFANYR